MTSRSLINGGGAQFLEGKDFSEPLDHDNERMTYDFLIESFEKHLNNLKGRDEYQN